MSSERSDRGTWVGRGIARKEDARLLRGAGTFTDDTGMHRMGYAHFVRSPYGHARISRIDTAAAEALPGVYATLTGDEVRTLQRAPFPQFAPEPGDSVRDYCLAAGTVRYHGEPVAVVLAATREAACDAARAIRVDYDPLPAITDVESALRPDSPTVHAEVGGNVSWQGTFDFGDVEAAARHADRVLRIDRLHFHRFTSAPLECNAAIVSWDRGTDSVTVISNNQMPQFAAMLLAPALGVPTDRMRFAAQDIGGGFGIKITTYPQIAALALISRKAGRPAKWTETRTEHLLASAHGNERTFLDVVVPVSADGVILGLSATALDDVGAYTRYEPLGAVIWSHVLTGCYRIRNVRVRHASVLTNKCPVGPNRGYSRMQHLWLVERVIDLVATELGLDPVQVRLRNYVRPEDYPYQTPNGCVYDSGDLPAMLRRALELIDYPAARAQQTTAGHGRAVDGTAGDGRLRIGIGIGSTLDSGTNNFGQARIINPHLPFSGNGEAAHARLDLHGEIVVTLGTVPQGQSHETTAAQVVADLLGVDPDRVNVRPGHDTRTATYIAFSGTYASQFAVTGLAAAAGAARLLAGEIATVAGASFGVPADEIELVDGTARVRRSPDRALVYPAIANLVYANNAALPATVADGVTLNCRYVYRPPFELPDLASKSGRLSLTYASQVHACVVTLDEETGQVAVLAYAAVDECGRRINPRIVEGQVHGAAAHGIAAALHESLVYDDSGRLLTDTFAEYAPIGVLDMPTLRTGSVQCPSPASPNGAKGMGEGGGAALHALASAVQDALAGTGRYVLESHLSPENLWRLLHGPGQPGGVRLLPGVAAE